MFYYASDDVGHPPIPVEDFARHVALNRSNMEELFIEEYKDLEVEQTLSQHNAKLSINRNKNRYNNITPCENGYNIVCSCVVHLINIYIR